jgi:hypothetical protein
LQRKDDWQQNPGAVFTHTKIITILKHLWITSLREIFKVLRINIPILQVSELNTNEVILPTI